MSTGLTGEIDIGIGSDDLGTAFYIKLWGYGCGRVVPNDTIDKGYGTGTRSGSLVLVHIIGNKSTAKSIEGLVVHKNTVDQYRIGATVGVSAPGIHGAYIGGGIFRKDAVYQRRTGISVYTVAVHSTG